MTIGERIDEVIKYHKTNRNQLSLKWNVSTSVLFHITKGRNLPSYDMILKILDEFPDISAEWLIKGEGEMLKKNTEKLSSENVKMMCDEEVIRQIEVLKKAFDAQEVTIKTLVEMNAYLKELLGNKKQ